MVVPVRTRFIGPPPSSVNCFLSANDPGGLFPLRELFLQREGVNDMESLFLTTLLISVVIGVLIIYHVTPEG